MLGLEKEETSITGRCLKESLLPKEEMSWIPRAKLGVLKTAATGGEWVDLCQ